MEEIIDEQGMRELLRPTEPLQRPSESALTMTQARQRRIATRIRFEREQFLQRKRDELKRAGHHPKP